MTFEEAVAAPGRKVYVAGTQVKDGKRALMIFSLADDGAKQLAARQVPDTELEALTTDLKARGLAVADSDFNCDFVWACNAGGIEVYDSKRKVLDAKGDRATLVDGSTVARTDIARVMSFASDDFIHRGVKAALRSGKEVELVTEVSLSATGDPTYSRNELLFETGWCSTLGTLIATWAGTGFEDQI
jgi:hypothetical protein